MNQNLLQEISKIKIFYNLKEEQLKKIISHAQIQHYKKDQFLFLEKEKIKKFYIVLSGLVKLATTDLNGNEAIINIIDTGTICDVFKENFSFNCQVLEDCQIMIFLAEDFKKIMKEDNDFLYNVLLDSASRNHDLISQLSSLKLGDAKNKIGQFLLKHSFKNNEKSKEIELQYSKSQLASYLGMRLETFSRVFHQLQNDGEILIKKDKIILTKQKSLCKYCNSEISNKCSSRDQSFCEQ